MEFLKKNYEKVLLGVVLLGLGAAAAMLPFKIGSERAALEDERSRIISRPVKALSNLDMTISEGAVKRLAQTASLDLSSTNRLFNPVPWQRTPDGRLLKFDERNIGPNAVTILKTSPLYLTLTLDSVNVASDNAVSYTIGVQREAAAKSSDRIKKQTTCRLNDKKDLFTLVEVKGKPDEPAQLVLQLNDTGERAPVTKEQPFKRIDGYLADLKYAPENKTWLNRRKDSLPLLAFNGEEYNIVAIQQNEVTLQAKSNQKKWTVKSSAAP